MTTHENANATDATCSVVTIGTYDGVHRGHRQLIEETKRAAAEHRCKSVIVTFRVHPSLVLRPEDPVPLLTTFEEKLALLRETGVDEIIVLEFDEERARESAEDFVIGDLVGRLGATEIVVGSNFRFGHQRRGDVALLKRLGTQYGFETKGIDLVVDDDHENVVSSTRIRRLIVEGEMTEAARLLGRSYVITGAFGDDAVFASDPELLVPPPGTYRVELSVERGDGQGDVSTTKTNVAVSDDRKIHMLAALGSLGFDRSSRLRMAFVFDRDPLEDADR